MKWWLSWTFIFVAATTPAQFRPVVQLDSLQNASGQAQLDALGTAIIDGIGFTLRLLGGYEVRTQPVPEGTVYDDAALASRSLEEGVNNIIFGEISRSDGGYRVTIAAYDQGLGEVVFENSVAFDSLFDAFDVVDGITLALVEGFSGVQLTFGSIRFERTPGNAPVAIRLGEVQLEQGVTVVDRVPAGDHLVTFTQERPLGQYEDRQTITVTTDGTVIVSVSTPELTAEEAALMDAGVAVWQTQALGGSGATGLDISPLETAQELLETPFFQQHRPDLVARYRGRFEALVSEMAPRDEEKLSGIVQNWLSADFAVAGRFVRDVPLREVLTLHVAPPVLAGTHGRVMPYRRINLDGSDVDWEGIPSFNDTTGDMRPGIVDSYEATDLVEIRFAYDAEYLYLMVRTADRTYQRQNTGYKFHFDMQPGTRVYLDIWPSKSSGDRIWAGYSTPETRDNVEWSALASRTRIAFTNGFPQSVLEIAIPLNTLANWRYFLREMNRLWVASEYIKAGEHTWVDTFDSPSRMPFPTRALLLAESE